MDNLTAGNPKAHRIRVYYSGSSDIYEGMPVCYSFDSTANWWGGSVADTGEVTAATTVTEGALNAIRYIQVEDPDADNIHAFAGVVAKGGWCGKTDPCKMDIYIPNGAIVPVRTDQNCTIGRTILAVHTGEAHLTGPYDTAGRPVAIACETSDLSGGAALVLAKLEPNLFIYQRGDAARLLIDDQDTGSGMQVNYFGANSACASGDFSNCVIVSETATVSNHSLIYCSLNNTGLGTSGFHVIQARGNAYGTAIGGDVNAVYAQMDLEASSGTTAGIAAGTFSKVHVKTSTGTISGKVVAGRFCLGLDTAVTGITSQLYFEHTTAVAETPDYLFEALYKSSIGGVSTSNITPSHGIPVYIEGAEYRLLLDKV